MDDGKTVVGCKRGKRQDCLEIGAMGAGNSVADEFLLVTRPEKQGSRHSRITTKRI